MTIAVGGCFTSVVHATEVSATAAKGVNNDVVVSSVGRRIVGTKKVLKVGWITEITVSFFPSLTNSDSHMSTKATLTISRGNLPTFSAKIFR